MIGSSLTSKMTFTPPRATVFSQNTCFSLIEKGQRQEVFDSRAEPDLRCKDRRVGFECNKGCRPYADDDYR